MSVIDHQPLLTTKIADLRQHWELLNRKYNELREKEILETQVDEKLRLATLIRETETERDRVEQELKVLENSPSEPDSNTRGVTGRNSNPGPKELAGELSTRNKMNIWKKLGIIIAPIFLAVLGFLEHYPTLIKNLYYYLFNEKPLEISSATYNLPTQTLIIKATVDTSKIVEPLNLKFWVKSDNAYPGNDACTGGDSPQKINKTVTYTAKCDLPETNITQRTAAVSYSSGPGLFYSDSYPIQPITEDGR